MTARGLDTMATEPKTGLKKQAGIIVLGKRLRADEAKRKKSKAEDLSGFFPLSDADFFGSDNVVVVDGTLEE